MGLDVIFAIINGSNKETGWARWTEGNKEFSYCKSEVNLRAERLIVWEEKKPYLQITLFYLMTTIITLKIPLVRGALDEQTFVESLSLSLAAIK